MTLDEILDLWDKESPLRKPHLDDESLNIPRLHARWLRILTTERLRLRKLESELKVLKLEKYEFYTQGPTKESREKGWEFPARGMILNKDSHMYLDADKEIQEANLRIAYQAEIVAAIELIFKSIQGRNWEISRCLEDLKFKSGN